MVNTARYVRYCEKGHTYIPETFDWDAGETHSVRPPERCHQCVKTFVTKCPKCDSAPYALNVHAGQEMPSRRPERCNQCGARLPWSRWRTDKWITIRRTCGHYWREFKTLDGAKVTLLIVMGLVALMLVGKITIPQLVELVKVIKE